MHRSERRAGYAVLEPGYAPEVIGPSKYRPGQYQNEGIWPWITCFLALAWSRVGDDQRARKIISSLFENDQQTTHEWIDSLTGHHHHPNFATAAGAAAWVIGEIGVMEPL
jgi:glycogen debranching enzyme